jgi:dynactin complex subunit
LLFLSFNEIFLIFRNKGTVAFVGEVHYAKGVFAGIVMDDPNVGKNDGNLYDLIMLSN